ncbi:hypothetical protein [Haliangium sp.]|uniref:hypothetical protein n=1 Tax=Haliangium sp. TaxID=2663208 RepID=UPI003D107F28
MTPDDLRTQIEQPFTSAGLYFHRFDFDAGAMIWTPMTRARYRASSFLDDRITRAANVELSVPIDAVWEHFVDLAPALPPPRLVLHTGYCGSTLLARVLGQAPGVLVLREPVPLLQLGLARAEPERLCGRDWDQMLALTLALLSRTLAPADLVVVKATSLCNVMLPALLAPERRALFLSTGLGDTIAAHAKSSVRVAEARAFFRHFAHALAGLVEAAASLVTDRVVDRLDDYQIIAANWAMQRWLARSHSGPGHLLELSADAFLADPASAVSTVAAQLGLGLDERAVSALVRDPVLSTHAKPAPGRAPRPYSAAVRRRELDTWRAAHAPDLAATTDWLRTWTRAHGLGELDQLLGPD